MPSLVPISFIPKSLTATSSPLAILALASHISTDIASLILIFLVLVKLVPTSLATCPELHSPLFSLASISPAQVSSICVSPVPASSASPVHVSLIPTALFLPSPIPCSLTSAVPIYPFPILEMLRIQFIRHCDMAIVSD